MAGGLLASTLLIAGCISTDARPSAQLQQKIEQARTADDHRELVVYYQTQASALLAKAEQHVQRALAYGPPTAYARLQNDLARHCSYIASLYRDAAEANLRLAKYHHQKESN